MTGLDAANLTLSSLSIVISIIGIVVTIVQVKKTRTAVEAAKSATSEAIAGLTARLTVTELADIRSGLGGIRSALSGNRFETALINTQSIIEQLSALRHRKGFESEVRHTEIQGIVAQLAKLRFKLEHKIADPLASISIPKANDMLADFASTFSVWAEEYRFITGTESE